MTEIAIPGRNAVESPLKTSEADQRAGRSVAQSLWRAGYAKCEGQSGAGAVLWGAVNPAPAARVSGRWQFGGRDERTR